VHTGSSPLAAKLADGFGPMPRMPGVVAATIATADVLSAARRGH
jgi:hypothetical protein